MAGPPGLRRRSGNRDSPARRPPRSSRYRPACAADRPPAHPACGRIAALYRAIQASRAALLRLAPSRRGAAPPHPGCRRPSPAASAPASARRHARGNSGSASPTLSRYSQITGLSNSASPSSVTRHGTFDSGLSASSSGGDACGLRRHLLDPAVEAAGDGAGHDLADIRAGRRVVQLHGGVPPQNLSFLARADRRRWRRRARAGTGWRPVRPPSATARVGWPAARC